MYQHKVARWRKAVRLKALEAQDGRCHYCRCPLTSDTATADHKWPRIRRGPFEPFNIAAACRSCNMAKSSLSESEFFKLIKKSRPPVGAPSEILLVWASRRIWRRTNKARERIERLAR